MITRMNLLRQSL